MTKLVRYRKNSRCPKWETRLTSTEHNSQLTRPRQVQCVHDRTTDHTCEYRGVPFGRHTKEAIEQERTDRAESKVICGAPLSRRQRYGRICKRLVFPDEGRCYLHR